MKKIFFVFVMALCFNSAFSQGEITTKFRTRVLFDMGYTDHNDANDRVYPYFSDFRVGAKAAMGDLSFKIDFGISADKLSIKDLLVNLKTKNGYFSFGNTFDTFSMDMVVSTVDLRFNNSALSSQAIASGRTLGATYFHILDKYYGAFGIYSDNSISQLFSPQESSTALAFTTRQLYRKIDDGDVMQFGGALSIRSTDGDDTHQSKGVVEYEVDGNSSMLSSPIMSVAVSDVKFNLKTNVELLLIKSRFMFQAECLRSELSRTGSNNSYTIWGGYAQLSYLLGSGGFGYDSDLAVPTRSEANTFELIGRIDYIDADCKRAEILAGKLTDFAIGLNYNISKQVALKFNTSYTVTHSNRDNNHITAVLRAQFTI